MKTNCITHRCIRKTCGHVWAREYEGTPKSDKEGLSRTTSEDHHNPSAQILFVITCLGKGKSVTEKKRKGGLDCPHCQKHIDAAIVARAMFSAGHWENTGRKKILRLCPKGCGKEFGAREMKAHIPRCDGPPAAPPAPLPRPRTIANR